jgi:hypothetical protein
MQLSSSLKRGEELLGVSEEVDAGGNRARPKIGTFIKDVITSQFKKQWPRSYHQVH